MALVEISEKEARLIGSAIGIVTSVARKDTMALLASTHIWKETMAGMTLEDTQILEDKLLVILSGPQVRIEL
jgi:hypothetical protein